MIKYKSLDEFLPLLDKVRPIGNGQYEALCPAHTDRTPSLHIKESDGKILLNCKAGCQTLDIVKALNLTMADLFIQGNNIGGVDNGKFGNQASVRKPVITATYDYRDDKGNLLFQAVRYEPKTFRQRRPDGNGNWISNIEGVTTVLYHLPDILKAKNSGEIIYLVEGEKDADKLWSYGLIATCNPMGAGKWKPEYTDTLTGAKVVIIADKDDAGRKHAKQVARQLETKAQLVKVMELPGDNGHDTSDWLDGGGDVDTLIKMVDNQPAFSALPTLSAADLMKKTFPPVKWVMPDILPDGTTLLCGKPKAGKSVLVLNICLAVATGGKALGTIQVEQGDVLYLSLEDGERRVKERLNLLLEGGPAPSSLDIACQWPRIDESGITDMESWLVKHPNARLIVIDTLKRIKPRENVGQSLYGQDYDSIQPLTELAKKWNVALIINHHLNKMRDADDPMDMISGSTGLTGAVDNAFVIKHGRGEADAVLTTCGRDIEDKKLALRLDYPCWVLLGDANECDISAARIEIFEYIEQHGALSPKQVSDAIEKNISTVKSLMWKMAKDETLIASGGKYNVKN